MGGPRSFDALRVLVENADAALIGGPDRVPEPAQAWEQYHDAIERGSGLAALRAATLSALGVGRFSNWEVALDLLLLSAEMGERSARRQLAILADRGEERVRSGEASSVALWRNVRAEIDVETLLSPPPIRWISDSPRIGVIKGLSSPPMARWLIRTSEGMLAPSQINDASLGEVRTHAMRTAMSASLTVLHRDLVSVAVQARVGRATGLPIAQHEPPNVISYLPGQQFEEHVDFFEPLSPHFRAELEVFGQRVATCVTYLNEDFEGAETYFPQAGLCLRGGIGDCIVFLNVLPDGQPDRRTLHAGLPPRRGRKWILSQWLRNKPQPLV